MESTSTLLGAADRTGLNSNPLTVAARKCAKSKKKLKNKKKYKRCKSRKCTSSKKKLKNKKKYKSCKRKCTTNKKKLKNKKKYKSCKPKAPQTAVEFPVGVPVVCVPYGTNYLDRGVSLYAFRRGVLEYFVTLTQTTVAGNYWQYGDIDVNCLNRLRWSTDFSKLVFEARQVGSSFDHIGVYDLRTGLSTDLTKFRQGTGFSSPTLDDEAPRFLGAGGGKVSYGSDQILFTRDSDREYYTALLSNPASEQPVAEPDDSNAYLGHPELLASGWFNPYSKGAQYLSNPTGTLVSRLNLSVPAGVAPATTGKVSSQLNCPASSSLGDVGWRDASHLITYISTSGPGNIEQLSVATINPDGTLASCRPLLPPTDREIQGVRLSFDATKVYFNAVGPDGTKSYSVATAGDTPTEPVVESPPYFPLDGEIAYPVQ